MMLKFQQYETSLKHKNHTHFDLIINNPTNLNVLISPVRVCAAVQEAQVRPGLTSQSSSPHRFTLSILLLSLSSLPLCLRSLGARASCAQLWHKAIAVR